MHISMISHSKLREIFSLETLNFCVLLFHHFLPRACVIFPLSLDMVADMVRLGVDMKNREAAVQRAAASILSMVRRQTKIQVAVARAYKVKKCYKTDQTTKKIKENNDSDDEVEL